MRLSFLLPLLSAALLASSSAHADEPSPPLTVAAPPASAPPLVTPGPPPPPPPPPAEELVEKSWYGWKLLILQGAADTFITAGAFIGLEDSSAGAAIGAIGYGTRVFGSMGIHIANDNLLVGILSVGNNIAFPLAGAVSGARISSGDPSPSPALYFGAALGFVAASAFDVSMAWSHLLGKSKPAVRVGPGSVQATFQF